MKKLYKVKLEENNPKGVKGYLGMAETIVRPALRRARNRITNA